AEGTFDTGSLNESFAVTIPTDGRDRQRTIAASNGVGFALQKGQEQGLQTESVDRGVYAIVGGDQKLPAARAGFVTQELRIDRFATTPDTVIVQVDVALDQPTAINGKAFDAAGRDNALYLLDSN